VPYEPHAHVQPTTLDESASVRRNLLNRGDEIVYEGPAASCAGRACGEGDMTSVTPFSAVSAVSVVLAVSVESRYGRGMIAEVRIRHPAHILHTPTTGLIATSTW
jgi:hypothetical protein